MPEPVSPQYKVILVVDDDETILDFIEMLLKKEGFNVRVAQNVKTALELLRTDAQIRFHLVVTDLMMPGMGGYDLVKELQQPIYQQVPVIVSSAREMDAGTSELIRMEPNVHDFMKKPVDSAELKAKIHALLGTQRGA